MNTKAWRVGSIILVLSNFVGIAHAFEGEAARVVEHCRSAITFSGPQAPDPAAAMNIGFCFGLMDGVRGANFYLRKAKSEVAFCEPPEFKNDDLAKAFVATVDKNPHLRELPYSSLLSVGQAVTTAGLAPIPVALGTWKVLEWAFGKYLTTYTKTYFRLKE